MIKAFAGLGIALGLLAALTVWIETNPEWARHQSEYKRIRSGVKKGIQQSWLPDLGRTDRCMTCHLGIEEPELVKAPQPLTAHPAMPPHDFGKFGCTVCHEGQGLATNADAAHRESENWGRPLIPTGLLEGSCGRCHAESRTRGAPTLSKGRKLIDSLGCVGCHAIRAAAKPVYIGPDLGKIGEKTGTGWLAKWIQNPKEYLPKTVMPDFKVSDTQAIDIAAYLVSLDTFPDLAKGAPEEPENPDKLIAQGKLLFSESRCISCHSVEGKGGVIGPDLARVGDKVKLSWLSQWLSAPADYFAKTRMPKFNFTPKEIEALAHYLKNELMDEGDAADVSPFPPDPVTKQTAIERGKNLVIQYGCTGCHEIPGATVAGREIGPALQTVGSKMTYQFDFGKTTIERSTLEWVYTKMLRPRIYGSTLMMPDYGLNPEDALAVTAALIGQPDTTLPTAYTKPAPVASANWVPTGPFGALMNKYRCLTCHSMNGTGGTLAPDLTIEGSTAKRGWIADYLKNPDVIRPFLVERMIKLNMPDSDAQVFADYFYTASRHDSIPAWTRSFENGEEAAGRKLYFEKYNCQSCHIIGKKGGYYGSPLDNVGARLEPAWIYARLLNVHKYVADSREPRIVSDTSDAKALAAFLATLRVRKGGSR